MNGVLISILSMGVRDNVVRNLVQFLYIIVNSYDYDIVIFYFIIDIGLLHFLK